MTRQNTKLIIMFIIGLPGLPMACLFWLLERYVSAYDLPPEKRMSHSKEGFIAMMCAMTAFCALYGGIYYSLMTCGK